MYYPGTSKKVLPPQQKKIVKTPLSKSMIQIRTAVSYIFENLDMKSTSWIGTHDKESLAPNYRKTSTSYGGKYFTAYWQDSAF